MRIILTTLAALSLALAFGGVASAPSRPAPSTPPDAEFTFEDDLVEGGSIGPEGSRIEARDRHRRRSLVRPRVHFVPELVHSIERI